MAPDPRTEGIAMKRSSSEAGLDAPASLKQFRHYRHQHRLAWKQGVESTGGWEQHNHEAFEKQLLRAVALVFEQVGFEQAEPAAIESMRQLATEYMANLLNCVRQTMLHARRVQPVPHDFLSALNANNLTLSALLPHLNPPIDPKQSQPSLAVDEPPNEEVTRATKLVEKMMVDPTPNKAYIPQSLPALPSRHTYKSESVFADREVDPKKVRERATEEGRLGEEALRRLVSSRSRAVNNMESRVEKAHRSCKQRGRDLWKATMATALQGGALLQGQQSNENAIEGLNEPALHEFDEYSIQVNADSIYWRKPATGKATASKTTDG